MKLTACLFIFANLAQEADNFILSQQSFSRSHTKNTPTIRQVIPSNSDFMNSYNIDYEEILGLWTAKKYAGNSITAEGIYLSNNDDTTYFIDTLNFELTRTVDKPGLGIELEELLGGRQDGIGITIVTGIVEGSNSDGLKLIPGDSITQIEVIDTIKSESGGVNLDEESAFVATECLDYDGTIGAILSLPAPSNPSSPQKVKLTIKRLRRKPKVTLNLQYPPNQNEPDQTIELFAGENLRRAMLVRGVKLNDKLSKRFDSGGMGDCGAEGTCATCVVGISDGMDLLSPIGLQEKQILAKNPRWRLACKSTIGYGMKEGNITVKVNPRQWD